MTHPKLWFSKFKKFAFWELQLKEISLNFQTFCCNLKIRSLGAKLFVSFLLFYVWKELWRFKVNKNINFNKNEMESKMENPTHFLERWALSFSSCKNRGLKVELWWVGASKRKNSAFSVLDILFKGNFLIFGFYLNV